MPRKSAATGRQAIGSIRDLPSFCKVFIIPCLLKIYLRYMLKAEWNKG
jgi:hypothetical protein